MLDLNAGVSIRAYVLNGSRRCIFSKWREWFPTNWISVEHEAGRETLSFLLLAHCDMNKADKLIVIVL